MHLQYNAMVGMLFLLILQKIVLTAVLLRVKARFYIYIYIYGQQQLTNSSSREPIVNTCNTMCIPRSINVTCIAIPCQKSFQNLQDFTQSWHHAHMLQRHDFGDVLL